MMETEQIILDELERLAPAGGAPQGNWDDVRARVVIGKPRRRRSRLVAVALTTVVAVAAPTLALSADLRSLLGLQPSPEISKAHLVVSAAIGNAFYAHLWRTASTSGGKCIYFTADHGSGFARAPIYGGVGCSLRGASPIDQVSARSPLGMFLSMRARGSEQGGREWVPPVVGGHFNEGLGIRRVEIRWRGGSLRLALKDGYFLGGSPLLYKPSFGKFPFVLVALDARGHIVAHRRLDSPWLLLMTHGWREYAKAYHRWKASH